MAFGKLPSGISANGLMQTMRLLITTSATRRGFTQPFSNMRISAPVKSIPHSLDFVVTQPLNSGCRRLFDDSHVWFSDRYGTSRYLGNGSEGTVHRRPQTAEGNGSTQSSECGRCCMGSPYVQRTVEGQASKRN